jgi:hypothetical protein
MNLGLNNPKRRRRDRGGKRFGENAAQPLRRPVRL